MATAALVTGLVGCGDEGGSSGPVEVPATYAFESQLEPGESSVSYPGQVMRQVLIADLADRINDMDSDIPASFTPTMDGDVVTELDAFFRFNSGTSGNQTPRLTTDPEALQETYDDISTDKDLVGKLAGNDSGDTDHKDWSNEFGGWSDESIADHGGSIGSPEGLVVAFFETFEELAIAQVGGPRLDDEGDPIPVYVADDGRDLKQLIQKFLLGAVTFSQAADDYLDDDVDGKGLLTDNVEPYKGTEPYTALEHQWDEGFGYFGAAADYGDYRDAEIAGKDDTHPDVRSDYAGGSHDTDGDGRIDLESEYNFGNSVNAGKRDLGANVDPDFTGQAFQAFLTGRAIINAAVGRPLTDEEMADLKEQRDLAVEAWEKAIVATIVHYINDTIVETGHIGTPEDYDFATHAKVWSEMKGFALGLQFNPRSPLSDEDFTTLHTLIGDAPVLEEAGAADYRDDLLAARDLLQQAYG
ncbi:MAG: DUF4856 domain-containing protein, partial [Myxococcota bacterium]